MQMGRTENPVEVTDAGGDHAMVTAEVDLRP